MDGANREITQESTATWSTKGIDRFRFFKHVSTATPFFAHAVRYSSRWLIASLQSPGECSRQGNSIRNDEHKTSAYAANRVRVSNQVSPSQVVCTTRNWYFAIAKGQYKRHR